MARTYEFRIAGHVSRELILTFSPDSVTDEADSTVFVRLVEDDEELFGAIARCETLKLRLIGMRQLDPGSASSITKSD